MGIVRNLLVRVGADLTDLQKKLKNAQKMFKNAGKDLQRTGESLTKNVTSPILAVGTALTAMTLGAARAADDLADLSAVTGIGVEDLQAMAYVGGQLGTDLETMTGAQTRLTRAIAEAHGGNKEAIKSFETLGVKIYDNNGKLKDANTLFWEVIDGLGGIEDPVLRDALAMDLMGKSARDLNPLIKAGSDEIKNLMQAAKDLGIVLGEDDVLKLAHLNDSFATLTAQIKSAAAQIAVELAPVLEDLIAKISEKLPAAVDKIIEMIQKFKELDPATQSLIIGTLGVVAAMGPAILVFSKVALAISGIIGWISGIAKAYTAWAAGTSGLGGILTAVFGSIGGVVLAVIAAIAALVAGFVWLWKNNEEFRNFIIGAWNTIKEVGISVWEGLKSFFTTTWETISSTAKGIWDGIVTFFTVTIPEKFNAFVNFFAELPGKVQEFLTDLFFDKIPYAIGYALGYMITKLTEEIPKIVQFFIDLPDKVWTWLQEVINKAITWGTNFVTEAKRIAKEVIDGIIGFFIELPGKVSTWLQNVIPKLTQFAVDAFREAQNIGNKIYDGIVEAVLKLPQKVADIIGGVWKSVTETISNIKDALSGAWESVKEGFSAGSNAAKPSQPIKVKGLATGGITMGPTLAMIGEGMEQEAVMPLSKLESLLELGNEGEKQPNIIQVILDGRVIQEYTDNKLGGRSFAFGGAY